MLQSRFISERFPLREGTVHALFIVISRQSPATEAGKATKLTRSGPLHLEASRCSVPLALGSEAHQNNNLHIRQATQTSDQGIWKDFPTSESECYKPESAREEQS